MTDYFETKSQPITKVMVWQAYKKVKANKGSAGIDGKTWDYVDNNLQEAESEGTVETSRKYNLSPSLISKWKERYLTKGAAGLRPQYNRVDLQVRALEEENKRLKRIIARQALELEV